MELSRFIVYFQPQRWAYDDAVSAGAEEEIDATAMLLNAEASRLASALEEGDEEVVALIEDEIIDGFEGPRTHRDVGNGPYNLSVVVCSPSDFFAENGIEDPKDITEEKLADLRQAYDIPRVLTMPNGRRFHPDSSDTPYIEGHVSLGLEHFINNDLEGALDIMSEALTGSSLLSDVAYEPVGVNDGGIRLRVAGDAGLIIEMAADHADEPEAPAPL